MPDSHVHWLSTVPDLLALSECFPDSFPFLLDSAASGPLGSHSILLFAGEERLVRHADGCIEGPGVGSSFFERLENWYQSDCVEPGIVRNEHGDEIPFIGGWFLFLGYEMAAEIESRLSLPANQTGFPDAVAWRCRGAVIVYHRTNPDGLPAPQALITAESEQILIAIQGLLRQPQNPLGQGIPALQSLHAEDPEKFESGVRRVLAYLRDGDAFQVNISRHWSGQFAQPPEIGAMYRCLRHSNPAPFAGLMRWNSMALLSSSPERLVQISDRQVQTRPIAGTRPRSNDREQDMALSRELIDNAKERAEHIMLIDLERNDLGRVCVPGSVEVNELMVIESYAHVHHIVSNVRGMLTPQASPVQAIKAVFPGGTITGCPKVRCMEIIAEMEQEGRGFYTGSMGYLGRNGSLDLNILIRTMLVRDRHISFRTGAGIVADSDPARELQETQDKARGLLLALERESQEAESA